MNFTEILARLGSVTVKTLSDARAMLAESVAALSAAVADLQAKSEALVSAQSELVQIKATHEQVVSELASVKQDLAAATERAAVAEGGTLAVLAESGIKIAKLEAPALKSALASRIEGEAQTLLAARGIKPLPEKLNSGAEIEANLSSEAQILAAYEAMPAGPERIAFYSKHEAAIWRAFNKA